MASYRIESVLCYMGVVDECCFEWALRLIYVRGVGLVGFFEVGDLV